MRAYYTAYCLSLILSGCHGREILTEEKNGCYVQVRTGREGYVQRGSGRIENRPDLENLIAVHGDLHFICQEINGVTNPRIVVESTNKNHYQVTFKQDDRESLKVLAKALNLVVTEEEREISALAIRVSPNGHRLKPSANGRNLKADEISVGDNGWPLDGITMDEFARFFERRYNLPVANLTELNGEWSILLSKKVARLVPEGNEKRELDDLGLTMQREQCKVLVTVVKDRTGQIR